jgi:type IV secretory pathway VirB4 component
MLDSGTGLFNMTFLKDRNRDLIFLLLDKIKATNDKKYIPLLEAWKAIDFKKVQAVIQHVINHLSKE